MGTDYACYIVIGIYSTLLFGCIIGIKINYNKKEHLILTGTYQQNARVIHWKRRFYLFLFFATICRMSVLVGATVLNYQLIITKADRQSQFLWQIAAAFGSMLYFTSFSLIVWFFAQISYHKKHRKERITLLMSTMNMMLYFGIVLLGTADYVTGQWYLIYDIQMPLFSVCNWILSILFVFFSCKIAQSISIETKETVDYHIEHSYSGHVGSLKRNRFLNKPPGPTNDTQYIVPRLIKLSILCASMWTIRGCYTAALRIWPSVNLVPFHLEPRTWEAIFYCISEYPASLGALFLMISKPKKSGVNEQVPAAQQEEEYPKAVDYEPPGLFE
eukprot:118548_1